jgi:hypothetical protein
MPPVSGTRTPARVKKYAGGMSKLVLRLTASPCLSAEAPIGRGGSGSGSAAGIASGSTGGRRWSARTIRHPAPRFWLKVPGRHMMRPYSQQAGSPPRGVA